MPLNNFHTRLEVFHHRSVPRCDTERTINGSTGTVLVVLVDTHASLSSRRTTSTKAPDTQALRLTVTSLASLSPAEESSAYPMCLQVDTTVSSIKSTRCD